MTCKQVWLTVAEGGRWTAQEVKERVKAQPAEIDRALYAMSHGGMLTKFDGAPVKYGVTQDCITPRQTSVSEIFKAMGMKA